MIEPRPRPEKDYPLSLRRQTRLCRRSLSSAILKHNSLHARLRQHTGLASPTAHLPLKGEECLSCAFRLAICLLTNTPCCLCRHRSRSAKAKVCTVGSRTVGHRHRQPRPSIRRRLGFGGIAHCGAHTKPAISCALFLFRELTRPLSARAAVYAHESSFLMRCICPIFRTY